MKLVVKLGGSLMKSRVPEAIVSDIAALTQAHAIALVHGGAEAVTEIATRLGKEQKFVVSPGGIRSRFTDMETAEIYHMVMSGFLSKKLVMAFGKAGVPAVSLSGVDGSLLRGRRKKRLVVVDERGRKVAIDGGYTGRVLGINSELADLLLSNGYLPVISPVAVGEVWEPLNVDGDRAASALAAGIRADAAVFTTNVDGLSLDGKLVSHLTPAEASSKLPLIGFGMQKKVMAAAEAVSSGVKEAIICSGTRDSPVTRALAHEKCTVISAR